jgi:hypothetical protein
MCAKASASSPSSRSSRWLVMALSIAVIGRTGWSPAPAPPSMWSTMAIAVSSG